MKEKIEQVKSFCKKNEDVIMIALVVVATATVNHIASRAALKSLSIDRIDMDKNENRLRVTYKNGDADYYHLKNK